MIATTTAPATHSVRDYRTVRYGLDSSITWPNPNQAAGNLLTPLSLDILNWVVPTLTPTAIAPGQSISFKDLADVARKRLRGADLLDQHRYKIAIDTLDLADAVAIACHLRWQDCENTGVLTKKDQMVYLFEGNLYTFSYYGLCLCTPLLWEEYWQVMKVLLADNGFLSRTRQL